MLKDLEVYRGYATDNPDPELLVTLPLAYLSSTDPYKILDIQGLGPVGADLAMTSHASWDGSLYQGARVPSRNIVIKLKYNPTLDNGDSIEALRRKLYVIFPPKGKVDLRFNYDDGKQFRIEGYVESQEPSIFDSDPSSQISILCEDAHFSSLDGVGRTVTVPGDVDISSFLGSAESEFRLALYPDVAISRIEVDNLVDDKMVWEGNLSAGQVWVLSTFRENTYIRVDQIMKLDELKQGSLRMKLSLSKPVLRITVDEAASFNATWWLIPKYLGV